MTPKVTKLIQLQPDIASAMTKASKALGLSGVAYVEQCVARCLVQDVERVALADQAASAEAARLIVDRQ